jgi:8-oxo-dGTP pyrophosphatase MutT (NUDIX family)
MFTPQSVAAILFSPDRSAVLLIERRDVPVWVLPGGGIEPGETSEAAAIREILEETGFHVKISRLVGAYTPVSRLAKPTHLYECAILSGAPTPSPESRQVRFFPLTALPPLLPPPYPEWIADALQELPAPIHRPLASITYSALFRYSLSHPLLVLRFLLARAGLPLNNGCTIRKK